MKTPFDLMRASPRCQAKSKRSGVRCQGPAVRGKRVCRMHGGISRPSRGKRHGRYSHGLFTYEAIAERRALREMLADTDQIERIMGTQV